MHIFGSEVSIRVAMARRRVFNCKSPPIPILGSDFRKQFWGPAGLGFERHKDVSGKFSEVTGWGGGGTNFVFVKDVLSEMAKTCVMHILGFVVSICVAMACRCILDCKSPYASGHFLVYKCCF